MDMDSQNKPLEIGVFSSAESVSGQGVGSAYKEQVALLKEHPESFTVHINEKGRFPLQHFHTIDPAFYLKMSKDSVNIAYCHFLPDTLEGSLRIPRFVMPLARKYIVSFYNKADHLVVVNPSFIEPLAQYGIPKSKIKYIPNFVSERDFYPMDETRKKQIRERLGLDPNRFTVLGCGQVQTRKGVWDFVETAKRLPEIQFVWAGGFSFGRLTDGYDELKKLMENPPANVTFTGIVPREQMNDIYNASDLLFVPSFSELFPMTILESASSHTPILCRDLELYEDILFDHYLKEKDVDGFVSAIEKLAGSSDFYKSQVEHSKALSHFYSRDHVYSLWKDFYQMASQTPKGRHP